MDFLNMRAIHKDHKKAPTKTALKGTVGTVVTVVLWNLKALWSLPLRSCVFHAATKYC